MVPSSSSTTVTASAAVTPTVNVALADVDVLRRSVPVLRGVNLRVAAGEAILLTGPNGVGKSTLLRLLATLLRPSQGTGTVLGHTLSDAAPRSVTAQIAYVAHEAALLPALTIRENLLLVASLRGLRAPAVERALERVGLAAAGGRTLRRCSAGMVRRTELARVFLSTPYLLLLDEAHAALDHPARSLVTALVGDVTARGGSAVLVAHDTEALEGVVQRTLVLRAGTIVA